MRSLTQPFMSCVNKGLQCGTRPSLLHRQQTMEALQQQRAVKIVFPDKYYATSDRRRHGKPFKSLPVRTEIFRKPFLPYSLSYHEPSSITLSPFLGAIIRYGLQRHIYQLSLLIIVLLFLLSLFVVFVQRANPVGPIWLQRQ